MGDGIINANEIKNVVVSGSGASIDSFVTVTFTDSSNKSVSVNATIANDGTYSIPPTDLSSLLDGPISVKVSETSNSGNQGSIINFTSTIDTIAPNSIKITLPIAGDNIINALEATSVNIVGTNVSSTSSVVVKVSDSQSTTLQFNAVVSGSTWFANSLNLSSLVDGSITVSAVETDAAGNTGSPVSVSITKNTFVSTSLTINTPIAGDNIVNFAEQSSVVVSGSGAEVGASIVVTFTDSMNSNKSVNAINNGDGTYSIPPTDLSSLVDGSITVSAVQTDVAGNTGSPVSVSITKDTVAPSSLIINTPIAGDNIVNFAEQSSVVVSGSGAESGASILVSFMDSIKNTIKVPATISINGTFYTSPVDISKLQDGNIIISVVETDFAGNIGSSLNTTVLKDTASTSNLTVNYPIEGDNIINNSEAGSVTISGSQVTSGSQLSVSFVDSGNNVITQNAIIDSNGNWVIPPTDIRLLSDGTIKIVLTENTPSGNIITQQIQVSKNTTLPQMFYINQPIAYNNIISITEVNNVFVTGTNGDPQCTLIVTFTDINGASISTEAIISSSGNWSTSVISVAGLSDGIVTVSAVETNIFGNSITATPVLVNLITRSTTEAITINTPISGDNKVNAIEQYALSISGAVTDPNSKVQVEFIDNSGNILSVNATVNPLTGEWKITNVNIASLSNGPISVVAITTNSSGVAVSSAPSWITLDNIIPNGIIISTPTEGSNIDTNQVSSIQVTGSGVESTSSVRVQFTDSFFNTETAYATVRPDGTWYATMSVSSLISGPISISALEIDAAGNVGVPASIIANIVRTVLSSSSSPLPTGSTTAISSSASIAPTPSSVQASNGPVTTSSRTPSHTKATSSSATPVASRTPSATQIFQEVSSTETPAPTKHMVALLNDDDDETSSSNILKLNVITLFIVILSLIL